MTRSTTNRNARGGSDSRRARREYLMSEFGDGELVDCTMHCSPDCWVAMSVHTVSADRYPVPGCEGGTYRRGNIRPGCPACQCSSGGKLGAARRAANRAAGNGTPARLDAPPTGGRIDTTSTPLSREGQRA